MNRFFFIFFLFFAFIVFESQSQTIDRNSIFRCAKIFGDSITFLNDFTVNNPRRKTTEDINGQEWDVYLIKGTMYRFALCCYSGGSTLIMKLYDDTVTEKNPYYFIKQHSKKSYFDYVCKKSALYKVSIRFNNEKNLNKELSAIGILGFIKKVKN